MARKGQQCSIPWTKGSVNFQLDFTNQALCFFVFLRLYLYFFFKAMSDLHVQFVNEGIKEIASEGFRDSAVLQTESLKVIHICYPVPRINFTIK